MEKIQMVRENLAEIKEDIKEVKVLLAMPDNNFMVINAVLSSIENQIEFILEDLQAKRKKEFVCPKFTGLTDDKEIEKR